MRTRDLKRIILKMFGDQEFYGYEIHKKLLSKNVKIEISRIYRVLNEMMKEELLEGHWERSRLGPRKKVYRLGREGMKELHEVFVNAIKIVHSSYGKYLMSLPPKVNVFNIILSVFTDGVRRQGNIAYLPSMYSVMHERMIYGLHNKMPEGKIYLVKPNAMIAKQTFDNLVFLDGAYDNIPLKNGHVDLLVIIDLPPKDMMETALREWHRVLNKNGKLTILTPTVLVKEYEDPLTIGDFVEKHEHETIEKGEKIGRELLQALLKNFFNVVKEREIVHMTIFLAAEPSVLQ